MENEMKKFLLGTITAMALVASTLASQAASITKAEPDSLGRTLIDVTEDQSR
jgi:hypothetical protein